jgi:subtilisin family serine protease
MKRLLLLVFVLQCVACFGEERYRFRLYLKDKGDNIEYSISNPHNYLSDEAIARRNKYGIKIDETDVPVNQAYIDSLEANGYVPIVCGKWLNTVVVEAIDSFSVNDLQNFSFVDSVKLVWKGEPYQGIDTTATNEYPSFFMPLQPLTDHYGYANEQVKMINAHKIHQLGYLGRGVRVAVLDSGFKNANKISAFDSTSILSTYNIVHPTVSVFDEDDHGLKTFSCLAANQPGSMVGTAPYADYHLIKCEDVDSEFPIEEDYWARAAEYADSIGADVISSSLGYYEYDDESLSPTQEELDGKTRLISVAAGIAAEKGIMIFCSAGNEGSGEWKKITFPADSEKVFTVGAVDKDKKRSSFSSFGFSENGRSVKPDAVAMGGGCAIINEDGNVGHASGTSFSNPILAGAVVCLMEAFPYITNQEIAELIHKNSSNHKAANPGTGYGIPDIFKAYKKELKNGNRRNK